MRALIFFLLIGLCFPIDLGSVVRDSDFLYNASASSNVWKFLKSFQGNRFTASEIEWLELNCRSNNISILWALARMQTEQGLVVNLDGWNYEHRLSRCFSYGFGTHSNDFKGYSNQVKYALRRIRVLSEEWKHGKTAPVKGYGNVLCKNLATYGLHRYNWVWGKESNFGVYNVGNSLFVSVLREFQSRYERVMKNQASIR